MVPGCLRPRLLVQTKDLGVQPQGPQPKATFQAPPPRNPPPSTGTPGCFLFSRAKCIWCELCAVCGVFPCSRGEFAAKRRAGGLRLQRGDGLLTSSNLGAARIHATAFHFAHCGLLNILPLALQHPQHRLCLTGFPKAGALSCKPTLKRSKNRTT